jgi:hypothetical protein
MELFLVLLPLFILFCFCWGRRIIVKAGFDGRWTMVFLVPVLNIIMIWLFAFSSWPKLPNNEDQTL